MKFITVQTNVRTITNIKATDSDTVNLLKSSIRWALNQISNSWNWPHLMEPLAFITTVAPHTTGNVDVNNGSKTVISGSTSAVFTEAMVGRKFRTEDQSAYYTIATWVSADEITLDQAFQGDDDTDASYTIYKDEYRLPANLDKVKIMRQIENAVPMTSLGSSVFDFLEPTPQAEGTPRFNVIAGSKRDIHSTGTVSASTNSSTITGDGTTWTDVDGLGKGIQLTIGSQVLTVKTVDSDTQITTYEKTTSVVSAGTSYELLMDNFIVQFFSIPNAAESIYFRYQRIAELLINSQDIPDLPNQYHHLLVNGSLSTMWKTKDKEEAKAELAIFLAGIQEMKKRIGTIATNTIFRRTSISEHFLREGVGDARFPGSYGYPFRP